MHENSNVAGKKLEYDTLKATTITWHLKLGCIIPNCIHRGVAELRTTCDTTSSIKMNEDSCENKMHKQ